MSIWPYTQIPNAGPVDAAELDAACQTKRAPIKLESAHVAGMDDTADWACGVCRNECTAVQACERPEAASRKPGISLWRRLRIWLLRFHINCLIDERENYISLGWTGPIYLRESYAQQRKLMARIRELEAQP